MTASKKQSEHELKSINELATSRAIYIAEQNYIEKQRRNHKKILFFDAYRISLLEEYPEYYIARIVLFKGEYSFYQEIVDYGEYLLQAMDEYKTESSYLEAV